MEVDRTFSQWSIGNPKIRWSALFAGGAVGLALQTVLTLAGLGFGAWPIDLHDVNPAEGIPVGAAVWTGLSILLSAFVGGYLTARISGSAERGDGVYHGVVVWAVNWLVFVWLTTTAMATVIGGAFSIFGTTLQTLEPWLSNAAAAAVSRTAGRINLSVDDVRQEIESVLRATGKPELQPDTVQHNAGRAADTLRQGEPLNRITDQSLAQLRDKLTALDRDAAVDLMVNKSRCPTPKLETSCNRRSACSAPYGTRFAASNSGRRPWRRTHWIVSEWSRCGCRDWRSSAWPSR